MAREGEPDPAPEPRLASGVQDKSLGPRRMCERLRVALEPGEILRFNLTRTIVAALALAVVPAGAQAQEPGGVDPSQLPPEVQEAIMELQQLQAQLQPIQQQAMADPEIQAEQQELGTQIQTAMAEADPEVPQHMARLQELAGDAEAAQAGEDQARMAAILEEAQVIEMQLNQAQQEALQRPEIAPRVEAFQQKVQARMVEVDPNAGALIERMDELQTQLMALMVR